MKTDDLISLLAAGAAPVPRHAAARRIGAALAVGLALSFAWLALWFGPRHDLLSLLGRPMFWIKLAFPTFIAAAGWVIVQRLARPGVPVRAAWLGLAAPLLAVWALAAVDLFLAAPDQRIGMMLGQSWRSCVVAIAALSLPVFVAAMLALRSLAPVRPALAGAAAGAMSGGAGAWVYALHCPETALPFLGIWYVIGMAVPVLVGALVGRRLLRW